MKKDLLYGTIILLMGSLLFYQFYKKPIKTENNVANIINLDKKPPVVYKDETGKTHAKKEVIIVTDDQAALLYKSQRDSLAKQLKIQERQIVGLTTASGKAEINFTPTMTLQDRDSLRNLAATQIDYESKWFDLHGRTDKPNFRATFRDSITLAFIKEKYGFLNLKDRISADIHSENPHMQYTNVRSWAVPEGRNNKARIGFGVTAGYGLQFRKNNDISSGFQMTGGLQIRF